MRSAFWPLEEWQLSAFGELWAFISWSGKQKYLSESTASMGVEKLQELVDVVLRGEKREITRGRSDAALGQGTRVDVVEIQQVLTGVFKTIKARYCIFFEQEIHRP